VGSHTTELTATKAILVDDTPVEIVVIRSRYGCVAPLERSKKKQHPVCLLNHQNEHYGSSAKGETTLKGGALGFN
jgi:hypothetical protein